MKKIFLTEIELDELVSKIKEAVCDGIIEQRKVDEDNRMLTIGEVQKLFTPKLSRPTINRLRSEGTLKEYKMGELDKPFFRLGEVMSAMKQVKKFNSRLQNRK